MFYKLSSPKFLNIQPVTNDGGTDLRKEGGSMNVHKGKGVWVREEKESDREREKVRTDEDICLFGFERLSLNTFISYLYVADLINSES